MKSKKRTVPEVIDLLEEFENEGSLKKVNLYKPFLKITRYKITGKWYDTQYRNFTVKEINLINKNRGVEVKKNFWPHEDFFIVLQGFGTKGFFHYLIF
jgi:hypothetical protein